MTMFRAIPYTHVIAGERPFTFLSPSGTTINTTAKRASAFSTRHASCATLHQPSIAKIETNTPPPGDGTLTNNVPVDDDYQSPPSSDAGEAAAEGKGPSGVQGGHNREEFWAWIAGQEDKKGSGKKERLKAWMKRVFLRKKEVPWVKPAENRFSLD